MSLRDHKQVGEVFQFLNRGLKNYFLLLRMPPNNRNIMNTSCFQSTVPINFKQVGGPEKKDLKPLAKMEATRVTALLRRQDILDGVTGVVTR